MADPLEPRELRPYQVFDSSFRGSVRGDFRPEVVEAATDAPTEDGYGGPPPPRAGHPSAEVYSTGDGNHGPSTEDAPGHYKIGNGVDAWNDLSSVDLSPLVPFACGETTLKTAGEGPGAGWVQIGATVHMADAPCYQAETAAETAQIPGQIDASGPIEAVLAPEAPGFSLAADGADLAELL